MLTVPTVHFLVHRRPLFGTLASSRLHSLLAVVCISSALPPPSLSQKPPVGEAVESLSSALFVAQLYPLEQARLYLKAGVGLAPAMTYGWVIASFSIRRSIWSADV